MRHTLQRRANGYHLAKAVRNDKLTIQQIEVPLVQPVIVCSDALITIMVQIKMAAGLEYANTIENDHDRIQAVINTVPRMDKIETILWKLLRKPLPITFPRGNRRQ